MLPKILTVVGSKPYPKTNILTQREKELCPEIHFPLVQVWGCELGTAETNNFQRLSSHEFCRNVSLKPSSGLEICPGKAITFKI